MPWTMWLGEESNPPINTPVWMLCEEDTCDPTQYPAIFKVFIEEYEDSEGGTERSKKTGKGWKFKLLDYDPEYEDEYLSPNVWKFIAWREMTDHAGSWDKILSE